MSCSLVLQHHASPIWTSRQEVQGRTLQEDHTRGKEKKTPTAEDETLPIELEVPVAPKQKGISINEPISQPPSLPAPVEGKGKKVLVDPPHPPKKQKRGPEHEPLLLNPALPQYRELKTQLKMKLHLNVGDSGTAMVEDYTKFLAEGCSAITPEVWDRFKSDQTGGLLNLGLMCSLVVSISLFFSSLSYLLSFVTLGLISLRLACFPDFFVHVAAQC